MPPLNLTQQPLIMGIVNVTPDSFSGDGVMKDSTFVAAARDRAAAMLGEGADIIDIGGESSRPGSSPIRAEEEINRIVPVVAAIRAKCGATPVISIDTTKAVVAEAALAAGANIINDITALQSDPALAAVVARHGCPIVLMHNRSQPKDVAMLSRIGWQYGAAVYGNVIEDVKRDLSTCIDTALSAGIAETNIIVDPGLGFGKSVAQNLALVKHIAEIKQLGYPVMVGASRKSFIGHTLDLPIEERLEGTAAIVALSAFLGADIIRVHDVKFMTRVTRMAVAVRDS